MYTGLFCISATILFVVALKILNASGLPFDFVSVYLALCAGLLLGGLITLAAMSAYYSDDR
jgi:hypothetical protein